MRETASKSALLLGPCSRWAHPASEWYQDRAEHASKREDGTVFHHCLHLHISELPFSMPEGELGRKVRAAMAFWDTNLKPRFDWVKTEVAFGAGLNSLAPTITVLDNVQNRAYPQNDNVMYGTADIVGLLKNGQLYVGDWKTGESDGADKQLLTLLYMAAMGLHPQPLLSARISCLSALDSGMAEHEREVGWGELMSHWDAIKAAIQASRMAPQPSLPVVGAHCTTQYCPHLAKCSAHLSAMKSLSGLPEASYPPTWAERPVDGQHAAAMAHGLAAIKRTTKYYDGFLKDWVKESPSNRIILDGREWKESGNGFRWNKMS